jgi:ArsR family transcriptional regulator
LEIPEPIRTELDGRGGIKGLTSTLPEEESIQDLTKTLQALSDPIRLKIIRLLGLQPLCPCILTRSIGVSDSKLSYHLSLLQDAGLIEGGQKGRWIIYSISEKGSDALQALNKISSD